jgi:hypothetical protein
MLHFPLCEFEGFSYVYKKNNNSITNIVMTSSKKRLINDGKNRASDCYNNIS